MKDIGYVMYDFLEGSNDFKRYVTKCMRTYGKQLTEVLSSPITEEYYKSLIQGGCNHREEQDGGKGISQSDQTT